MFVGDIPQAIGFITPEVVIALLFYWWYSKKRRPKADALGVTDLRPAIRRHKIKGVLFSALIFIGLLTLAVNGSKNSDGVTWTVGKCVAASGSKVSGYTSCSSDHFAKIIAIVKYKENCPPSTTNDVKEASGDSSPGSFVCLDSDE